VSLNKGEIEFWKKKKKNGRADAESNQLPGSAPKPQYYLKIQNPIKE